MTPLAARSTIDFNGFAEGLRASNKSGAGTKALLQFSTYHHRDSHRVSHSILEEVRRMIEYVLAEKAADAWAGVVRSSLTFRAHGRQR
jgi:hypothetical protein